MNDDEIADLSLNEVAACIADGRLTSREVTRVCLDRIATLGRQHRSVVRCEPGAALAAAERADEELAAGRLRGPLHGVPLAHKDMFYRQGQISACGSRILADHRPDHTAHVLKRLDMAGALDIARLNMTEFATGAPVYGHNPITGTPRNPWNTDHGTGGSSSGPASAVAARLIYGALASDTGGSIRVPASCCGVVGIMPTYGRVSRYGAMPLSTSWDHVGAMTRTVKDSALMLGVIAGHDSNDPASNTSPVPDYVSDIEDGAKGVRIAVSEDYFYDYVDDEVRRHLDASLASLRTAGADIVHIRLPESLDGALEMHRIVFQFEAARYHRKWISDRPDDYTAWTRQRLAPGLDIPVERYAEALEQRERLLAEFSAAVFDQADMLHAPVVPTPVPTIAESDPDNRDDYLELSARVSHTTRPINAFHLPALSLPAGLDHNRVPVGFQLIGRPDDEATLFRIGRAYERESGWQTFGPPI